MGDAIQSILNNGPFRISIACTGAGAGIQGDIWDIPGISSILAEANFPYATDATDAFLGYKPDRYCTPEMAIAMAMRCYYRAYLPGGAKAIGLGLCASVSSNRTHRGDHRVYAAWFSDHGCKVFGMTLQKDERNHPNTVRAADGRLADMLGIDALLDATGLETLGGWDESYAFNDGMNIAREEFFSRPFFSATGKRMTTKEADVEALFPGAFNPPHDGHLGMAKVFRKLSGLTPTFNVTAETPHKPPVPLADLLQRAKLLEGQDRLFSKNDGMYLDKARALPNTPIIIGSDALARIFDPKWGMDPVEAQNEFIKLGTRFYVTERAMNGEETIKVESFPMIPGFAERVEVLPGRWNISSSELRAKVTSPSSTP